MSAGKLFKMAMMTEADNRDKAIKHYKQIINDFPEDEYAIRAKNRLDNLENSTSSIGEYLDKYAEMNEDINGLILTTSNFLEGYKVEETIEIVTAECVYGINIFSIFFTDLSFFRGRSQTTQKVLRDARRICLYELKKEAHSVGANAVIAVDLDYSEFTGKGKPMLFLVASGTAVKVNKCV